VRNSIQAGQPSIPGNLASLKKGNRKNTRVSSEKSKHEEGWGENSLPLQVGVELVLALVDKLLREVVRHQLDLLFGKLWDVGQQMISLVVLPDLGIMMAVCVGEETTAEQTKKGGVVSVGNEKAVCVSIGRQTSSSSHTNRANRLKTFHFRSPRVPT